MIICYNVSQKALEVLKDLHLPYCIVDQTMLNQTLGYLFGLAGFEKNESHTQDTFDFDLMILHEVDDETLQELTKKLKEQHANVERKAMLTQHNRYWKLGDMLQEIDREHAYFQCYDAIMKLLQEAEHLQAEAYDEPAWENYQKSFIHAYETLQKQPEDIRELQQALQQLKASREALQ